MKKILLGFVLALSFATPALATEDNDHKTVICHVPPGNPENAQTIEIDDNALKAHLGDNDEGLHGGDSYGPCEPVSTPTPTPTPTPAPTETPSPTDTPTPTDTPEPTDTPRTLGLTPVCVDDEGQLVWTIQANVNGTVDAKQGSLTLDGIAVGKGAENMLVFGFEGEGDVTVTYSGSEISASASGASESCGPAPTSTPNTPNAPHASSLPFLPPTDTASDEGIDGTNLLIAIVAGLIGGAIAAYVVGRRR